MDRKERDRRYYEQHKQEKIKKVMDYYEQNKERINEDRRIKRKDNFRFFGVIPAVKL